MSYEIGDRVRVFPQSKAHACLRGAVGTVERVVHGYPAEGALHVRLDVSPTHRDPES